ncbi:iron complex transport system substrate-binding protein [Candidatus Magnetomoraceae bacterium gMMP-13]
MLKRKIIIVLNMVMFVGLFSGTEALSYPVSFVDSQDRLVLITNKPSRVVSLVPGITEIICKIGAGDSVKGVTYHDIYPPEAASKKIVGGFFSPSLDQIEKMQPDVIFISKIHKKVMEKFGKECLLINLESRSVLDIYKHINLLGTIFNKENKAEQVINEIKRDFEIISKKTANISNEKKKRVIRLMGRDKIMTPGDDSFQNEYIRLAGGIPPQLGKNGNIVEITKEEWMAFNPQIIYGCGGDRTITNKFFDKPGWKEVDAVKNGKIFWFPCDLTCRASTRTGYFVSCLAARIYNNKFSVKEKQVHKDHVFKSRELSLDLDYIKDVNILYSYLHDFVHKTLVINFNKPFAVVSTLEGQQENIETIGNSYSPPQSWELYHKIGLKGSRNNLLKVLKKTEDKSSFLFTGADMDHLSIKQKQFKDMQVYALVTAGVRSNALKMSKDTGNYYEPGTINMIILTNMKLTKRAMTRAIISATEAKTAALLDMDIRSSYTPLLHQATGTGTDNIIVAEGNGVKIDNAGGHTKMGELIAKAVYDGVQEAIYKQNGFIKKRNLFQRLKERKINLFGLLENCDCNISENDVFKNLDKIFLNQHYAGFLEVAFAINDHYEQGLIPDLTAFKHWCRQVAEEIAGKKIETMQKFISKEDMPVVMKMAINAVLNGLYH